MNLITRHLNAAIEHHRVEKEFRKELKDADLSRFHKEMTQQWHPLLIVYRGRDYKEAVQLAIKIMDGTEQPKIFGIFATLGRQLMDKTIARRLLKYNRLIIERAAAHREIDAKYKPAKAPQPLL